MNKNIVVLKGDGIGPEIIDETIKALKKIEKKYSHNFSFEYLDIGGCSIDKYGVPITDENIEKCLKSDSVLLGAVGGYKWDNVEPSIRPEKALLKLRKALNLYANLRPTKLFKSVSYASSLKESVFNNGVDFVIIRELTGGIYFGERETKTVEGKKIAYDKMIYSEDEILRIGRVAFETAKKLNKPLTSVDKANVLDTSRLWREIMHKLYSEYKTVKYNDMYVDNASMQLIANPSQFGVIVTENMFGDILSDEASMLSGSIGMASSASLSDTTLGMYEPIHGSAPDIAGKNIANPIGAILSASLMLKYSFNMIKESEDIDNAVNKALEDGYRTIDIMPKDEKYIKENNILNIGCSKMGDIIASNI